VERVAATKDGPSSGNNKMKSVQSNMYAYVRNVRRLAHGNLVPPGDLFYQHDEMDMRQE
jgi:hypothetical protein